MKISEGACFPLLGTKITLSINIGLGLGAAMPKKKKTSKKSARTKSGPNAAGNGKCPEDLTLESVQEIIDSGQVPISEPFQGSPPLLVTATLEDKPQICSSNAHRLVRLKQYLFTELLISGRLVRCKMQRLPVTRSTLCTFE